MGTFLTDKCAEIRGWLAIGSDVYSDLVITSWIRMAEEQLSTMLRVKHMVQTDTSVITVDRVRLPYDWQEIRLMRLLSGANNGGVCRYQTPDEFYNPEFPDAPVATGTYRKARYTILGNYAVIDRAVASGLSVELTYYQDIPALSNDANNWINTYHPTVYTLKILHVASMYAIEDDRGPMWDKEVGTTCEAMNLRHKMDMASGSALVPARRKTFG